MKQQVWLSNLPFPLGITCLGTVLYCCLSDRIFFISQRSTLSLRSALYPLIGNKIYGPIGHFVDILVIVITTFGISQALAIGVLQINAGLHKVLA